MKIIKKNDLNKITIRLPCKIIDVLKKIDKNALGIVFVIDKRLKLLGSISDGDIRRILIKNKDPGYILSINSKGINKKPISLPVNTNVVQIQEFLNDKIKNKKLRCIPLIDRLGRIVDYSTRDRVRKFSVLEPLISEKELSYAANAIKSGWISSRGAYLTKFENAFAKYLGGGFPVAVTSGTTALQIAISALGIKKNDEIIVPNFTFAATINSIINSGATPVIAEVEKETWTLDISKLQKYITRKTKAIMLVHIYGQPGKIDEIKKLAKKFKLKLIEDCAEAVGAKYKGRLVGLDGDCSCFSFFANKTITSGEGGMAVFKKRDNAQLARQLINHGLSTEKRYFHEYVGTNFRMTNMQAAIGLAQLERVQELLKKRKNIFKNYNKLLSKKNSVQLLPNNNWSENSYWLYTIILKKINRFQRDKIIENMLSNGIECRPGFFSLNLMPPYKKFAKGNYKISNTLSDKTISLPTTNVSFKDINFIVNTLMSEMRDIK